MKENLIRLGIFYDGNYLLHVSNYYNYFHERKSRISLHGLNKYIKYYVSSIEDIDTKYVTITESHYFKSRLSVKEVGNKQNQLFFDRLFDDVLMMENVVAHYHPVRNIQGIKMEKEIGMNLALHAYEIASNKKIDLLVLIACDGDYVSLIKKINGLGIKVLLISWDFEYTDDQNYLRMTKTSQDLIEEATYHLALNEIIDDPANKGNSFVEGLFVSKLDRRYDIPQYFDEVSNEDLSTLESDNQIHESSILSLKNGYGFIKYPPNNLFFHYQSVQDADFNELQIGDEVFFEIAKKDNGEELAINVRPKKTNSIENLEF
ncbi:MAG TPA: NYN domain-containing protein [Bacteroidales bacterium]|nr:NYN domain-containing protein [Bacteroidales bacterium]HPZ35795.1 NYN domain-containing protein [Bacteroidales bacterium]HQD34004.1 NYN domain-containing protein [Bacteroidales bacterium]HXK90997.1 NYN domain-containing protein [Bacteroidales bacterium]